jgi:uncharacterized membrane protein YdjX (TVP38/TMEM64 family)
VCIILFALAVAALTLIFFPFFLKLKEDAYREAFGVWVHGLGFRGAALLFALQLVQIVAAFIPGGPVEVLAGAAYGALIGTALCIAGSLLASAGIFLCMRKFGGALGERFFGKEKLRFWAFLNDAKRIDLVVFILFIIPGMPKDLLTWIAPLNKNIAFARFIILSNTARLPAILCSAIMGDSVITGNWRLFVVIFAVTAASGLAGILLRERVLKRLRGTPPAVTCSARSSETAASARLRDC